MWSMGSTSQVKVLCSSRRWVSSSARVQPVSGLGEAWESQFSSTRLASRGSHDRNKSRKRKMPPGQSIAAIRASAIAFQKSGKWCSAWRE
jgi:hypothetical protein